MIKYIVFDLDGTLLNTLTDLANSTNHALESLGLPTHPEESYKYFVGGGKRVLIEKSLGEHLTAETYSQAEGLFAAHYGVHGEDCTCPYDGIVPMLEGLKARGIVSAVVSNKPHQFCQVLVPKYFGDLIAHSLGHVEGTPAKPDPQTTLRALELMGATPAETLYIGDSGVDMATAKNSGLTAVGILWGFRGAQELTDHGADHLCATVEELEQLIFTL